LGDLGATYDDRLRFVGKRVGDFLLVLTLYCMRYEIFIKKIRNFDCVLTMQSVITGNIFQNFKITHFGERNIMPIGTCMQLLVKPVTVTGTHCSAERHLYAEAQETVCNGAAMPFGIIKCRSALPCSLRKNMRVCLVKQLIFIFFARSLIVIFLNYKNVFYKLLFKRNLK